MVKFKSKIAFFLLLLTVFAAAFAFSSCGNSKTLKAEVKISYLTEEEYLSEDIDGKLRESLDVSANQKGYAVFDLTISEMKNISENAKGTVTIKFTPEGGNDFSYKVEEFPVGDYTKKDNSVSTEFKFNDGSEKVKHYRFVVSVTKATTGNVSMFFSFEPKSRTTTITNSSLKRMFNKSGAITVGGGLAKESKLEYSLSSDGSYYTVVGLGEETGDTVIIPDKHNGLPIKEIAPNVFSSISYLKEVTLSAGLEKIGNGAFKNCASLKKIIIPKSVTVIGKNVFDGCDEINYYCEASEMPSGWSDDCIQSGAYVSWKYSSSFVFQLSDSGDYYILKSGKGAAGDVTVPDKYMGVPVTEIAESAFLDCTTLTWVTIPDSITAIGRNALKNTGIYGNTANWKDGALYVGKHLIALNNVSGAYNVKEGTLCIAGNVFKGFSALTSVTLPSSVVSIGDFAFSGCEKLSGITIPDGVKYIGTCAFRDCDAVTEIAVPDSVTRMGEQVFLNCDNLKTVTIGDGVTEILSYMFSGCAELTSVTLGSGVNKIGCGIFHGVFKLTYLYINSGEEWYCSTLPTATKGIDMKLTNAYENSQKFLIRYSSYYWFKK